MRRRVAVLVPKSPLWLLLLLAAVAFGAKSSPDKPPSFVYPTRSTTSTTTPAPFNGTLPEKPRPGSRNREQYLFNVFEVIVSTLESKLQRIENLDKAVEHLMRRVENLDNRVTDNLDKTDSVIQKLRSLDLRLFQGGLRSSNSAESTLRGPNTKDAVESLDMRLVSLNKKVSDIDTKLNGLKNQLDSNFLPADDINAEASEKKTMSIDISKAINTEVMQHISREFDGLKNTASSVERKLQVHMTTVHDQMNRALLMIGEIREAVVEPESKNATLLRNSKLDKLSRQMSPILGVSEKMDEVWDMVVGTKSSVDGLVPKSDELLTQTQRQERAINDIHADLRVKTNKIIQNLDMVEQRLKKQEDMVQRPVPADLLLDPTIDRLVEYDPARYTVEGALPAPDEIVQLSPLTTTPVPTSATPTTPGVPSTSGLPVVQVTAASSSLNRVGPSRNRIIFPSVKNKPSPANTTFTSEVIANIKDVKGYSCVDLMNAGMRDSAVYYLQIRGTTYWYLKVYCEQEVADGGWTVIQRRDDFGEPRENFNRDWSDYKNGFGDPSKEFWLGNENIYMLTNNEEYMLRVELEDFEGNKRYAQYSHFKIYSEAEYYKLEIDGYEGNGGDSLNDPWYGSNNSPFSTYNKDNDRSSLNCASMLKGGWWWKSCGRGLNGLYLNDPQDLTARQGIVWFRWRGWDYTLKRASMMIKPKGAVTSP
ncbi:angiopoietin-4 [Neocloeon triangulifer]|uniref:angiopoietin-4 n=1 Tax=Neocloeon triangulifer TaxID=2078957 RepID=UPI00286EBACF|nr:angiopoietin-4 [Neocloeon triangulifer]